MRANTGPTWDTSTLLPVRGGVVMMTRRSGWVMASSRASEMSLIVGVTT